MAHIVRVHAPEVLTAHLLPDGSAVLFEDTTKDTYSLNPSASAAWVATAEATTLPQIARAMSRTLGVPVTEALAQAAVLKLADAGLVVAEIAPETSRRELLRVAAGLMPLVTVLTGAQQRAFAQQATSAPPPPEGGPGPGGGPDGGEGEGGPAQFPLAKECPTFLIQFAKGVDADGATTPLAGALFTLYDPRDMVVALIITDANGFGEYTIITPFLGTYRLVEDHLNAPGGPYLPFQRDIQVPQMIVGQVCEWKRDLHNIKATAL